MKHSLTLLAREMKDMIVDKAINCEMDGDMNELHVDSVMEEALEVLSTHEEYTRAVMREKLAQYISVDNDIDIDVDLTVLSALSRSGAGDDPAECHVEIREQFEDTFTVDELLDHIKN